LFISYQTDQRCCHEHTGLLPDTSIKLRRLTGGYISNRQDRGGSV
jgi:hypothetical protein